LIVAQVKLGYYAPISIYLRKRRLKESKAIPKAKTFMHSILIPPPHDLNAYDTEIMRERLWSQEEFLL
jgi:hypothetical protein